MDAILRPDKCILCGAVCHGWVCEKHDDKHDEYQERLGEDSSDDFFDYNIGD